MLTLTITQNNQLNVANSFATTQESKPVKQHQSFRNIKKKLSKQFYKHKNMQLYKIVCFEVSNLF
jgi:hypothetical protein